MPPNDQEPRYQLVDSNGNVVGSFFGDGSGNVVIADETDTQTTFGPDGITTPALEAGSVNTGQAEIGNSFLTVTSDAELTDVLDNAEQGTIIFLLPTDVYSEDRTISKDLTFYGSAGTGGEGSAIQGSWTLNATGITFTNIEAPQSFDLTVNKEFCRIVASTISKKATITVASNTFVYTSNYGADITFQSGTEAGIVDGSTETTVTDNGTNTVGDIA